MFTQKGSSETETEFRPKSEIGSKLLHSLYLDVKREAQQK